MEPTNGESLRAESRTECQAGNLLRADALAREAVEFDWKRRDVRALSIDLGRLAVIAAERREFDRAATLLGAAESLRPPGDAEDDVEATQATVAAAMDPADFERAQRSGRGMSVADAAGFALGTTEGGEACP